MHFRDLGRCLLITIPLGFSACRDAEVTNYRVKKEPTPAPPQHAHSAAAVAAGAPAPGRPAEAAPAAPNAAASPTNRDMASTPVATAQGAGLAWDAPAHWTSKAGSAMRKATYVIAGKGGSGDAELAVTAFPGDVGGNLANVNRWRQQLGLPPISANDLPSALTTLTPNGLTVYVVDLQGPAGAHTQRVLGAIVPFGGSTWFFKLTGPDALVSQEKATYIAFLQTLRKS